MRAPTLSFQPLLRSRGDALGGLVFVSGMSAISARLLRLSIRPSEFEAFFQEFYHRQSAAHRVPLNSFRNAAVILNLSVTTEFSRLILLLTGFAGAWAIDYRSPI